MHFRAGLEETAVVDVLLELLTIEEVFPGAGGGSDRIDRRAGRLGVVHRDCNFCPFLHLQRLQWFQLAFAIAGSDRLRHGFLLSDRRIQGVETTRATLYLLHYSAPMERDRCGAEKWGRTSSPDVSRLFRLGASHLPAWRPSLQTRHPRRHACPPGWRRERGPASP